MSDVIAKDQQDVGKQDGGKQDAPKKKNLTDPLQIAWLEELMKRSPESGKLEAEEIGETLKKKQAMRDKIGQTLTDKGEQISRAQNYELEEQNVGIKGAVREFFGQKKTLQSKDAGGDANKEVDTWAEKMGKFKGLPPEQLKAIMESEAIILDLTEKLRETDPPGDPNGKRLFTDDEIADEIWTTMMRQRLIPENAVPDQYSHVVKTFQGASAGYDDKLAEYTDELDDNHNLLAALGMSKQAIGNLQTMADSIVGVVGDFANIPASEITTIVDLVAITTISTITIAEQALGDKDPAEILQAICDVAVQGIATGFVGKDGKEDKALKSVLTLSVKSLIAGGKAGILLAQGKPGEAVDSMADFLGSYIQMYAPDGQEAEYKLIGEAVSGSIKGMKSVVGGFTALAQKDYNGAILKFAGALQEAVIVGGNKGLEEYLKDKGDTSDQIDKAQESFTKSAELVSTSGELLTLVMTKKPEELQKLLGTMPKEESAKVKEVQDKLAKMSEPEKKQLEKLQEKRLNANADAMFAQGEEEARSFRNLLARGESGEACDAEDIKTMILMMKKQQKTLELALKLVGMGAAMIGHFFPPAAMAVTGLKLAAEMKAAAECGEEYLKWRTNVADAKSAASVQVEAMVNRANLSSDQALRHAIEAAIKTVQLIGQALQMSGHFGAHVGIALDKGASATSAAKAVIQQMVDLKRARKAWRMYREAKNNPKNRLAARKALRLNPTLAKYAVAYGALYMADPIALNAMRRCGLTEKVLSDRKTKVDSVVDYLNTMYSEDPVVLNAIARPQKWHPGEVELTADSWVRFLQRGEKKADPPLKEGTEATQVNSALALYEGTRKLYDAEPADAHAWETIDALIGRLRALVNALGAFRPVTKKGEPHAEFAEYVDTLKALAETELLKAEKEQKLLPDPADEEVTGEEMQALFADVTAEDDGGEDDQAEEGDDAGESPEDDEADEEDEDGDNAEEEGDDEDENPEPLRRTGTI